MVVLNAKRSEGMHIESNSFASINRRHVRCGETVGLRPSNANTSKLYLSPFFDFCVSRALDGLVRTFKFISINRLRLALHQGAVPRRKHVLDIGQIRLHRMHNFVDGGHLAMGITRRNASRECRLSKRAKTD